MYLIDSDSKDNLQTSTQHNTTWCHNPQDLNLNLHHCENLKTQICKKTCFWPDYRDCCHSSLWHNDVWV